MNDLWEDLPQHLRENPFFHFSAETDFVPAWDRIRPEHILPAFNHVLKHARRAVQKIAEDESPATFENTVVALEEIFALPGYFAGIAWNMMPGKEHEAAHEKAVDKITEKYSAFFNEVFRHNDALYYRLCTVWPHLRPEGEQPWLAPPGLEDFDAAINELVTARGTPIPEDMQQKNHLYMMYQNGFTEAGIDFSYAKRKRLDELDRQITKLSLKAQRNMKRANQGFCVLVDSEAELSGLSKPVRDNARKLAEEFGFPGQWAFGLGRETHFPVMQTADDRGLRRRMWETYNEQATSGRYDNRQIVLDLARLQQKRLRLQKYRHVAHDVLQYNMAGDAKTVKKFLDRMSAATLPVAKRELNELRAFARKRDGIELEPWDVKYYAEILKKERFGFDEEELSEYFELEHVLKETFEHFRKQLGIRFEESPETPAYHPDVRAFKVYDEKTNAPLATVFLDLLARDDKPAGTAWDVNIWAQGEYQGKDRRPIDVIVCKFVRGEPTLLSHDSVQTLWHELGHAVNNVVSQCKFPSFSGYYVRHDFVEFCSQFQENFVWEPEVLQTLARHYKTGAPLAPEKIQSLADSRKFMAGTDLLELRLKKSVLDYRWHTANLDKVTNVEDFERAATARHRLLKSDTVTELPHMAHISGGGYEANFYSYPWSLYHEADAFGRFKEEGLYSPAVTRDFRRIAEKGGSEEPGDLFEAFRGRAPDEKYFFERHGLRIPFLKAAAPRKPPAATQLSHKYAKVAADYGHDRDAIFAYLAKQESDPPPFVPASRIAARPAILEMAHRPGMEPPSEQLTLFPPPPPSAAVA